MGPREADSGSPEVIILPAIPWLRDGIGHEVYLESCLAHIKAQEIPPHVTLLPPFITSPIDDDVEIPEKYLYHLTVPKLNEIVDELQKTEATHVMFFDADSEAPPDALKLLLEHDVDVASAISPPRKNWKYTTALYYVAAPTPALIQSEPYFRAYTMAELRHVIVGSNELVATGHFCCLIKRSLFGTFRFRWPGLKVTKSKLVECPACGESHPFLYDCAKSRLGAEILFWMDAQMLGFSVRIDGRVLCGHLPQWPLSEYVGE